MNKNIIPKGLYCYGGHLGKDRCPYYIYKNIVKDVEIPYCTYLKEGDIFKCGREELKKLRKFHRCSNKELWKIYPLDLLWDQVKECGINEE